MTAPLPPVGQDPASQPFALALGLERIGLLAVRAPLVVGLVFAALAVIAAFGVTRLKVDDSLSQLFRSDTPEFRQYEEVTHRFPSNEYDVLVVVTSPDLLARDSIEKLRDAVTDLQLIDGTRGLISLFSARQPPDGAGGIPQPVFPDPLPQGADYDALVQRVRNNEIIRGKLLSEDGTLALIVLCAGTPQWSAATSLEKPSPISERLMAE